MAKYPEIECLEEFISANDVLITPIPDRYLDQKGYFTKVEFRIRTKTFILFVDDEFEDLKLNKPRPYLCALFYGRLKECTLKVLIQVGVRRLTSMNRMQKFEIILTTFYRLARSLKRSLEHLTV